MKKISLIFTVLGIWSAILIESDARGQALNENMVAQSWIDGWNSTDPEKLVAAFTSNGVYEDVTFGIVKKGSAELRDLHKFFHDAVGGLYAKLIDTHIANGHGSIEWIFGGIDKDVFKTGKPFSVRGGSALSMSSTAGFRVTSTITTLLRSCGRSVFYLNKKVNGCTENCTFLPFGLVRPEHCHP